MSWQSEERWIEQDNRNWTRKHFYRRLPGMSDEDYDIARERCEEPTEFFRHPEQLDLPYAPDVTGPLPQRTVPLVRKPVASVSEILEDEIHECLRRR